MGYGLIKGDEDEPEEAFEVRITSCIVDESGGATNKIPEGLEGVYACSTGAEYTAAVIVVLAPESDDQFTTTTVGDMPIWVWIPIGVAAVAIPMISFAIWYFYRARKFAEMMEIRRKHELDQAEQQDNFAEFGGFGDNVKVNPLATGDAFEMPRVSKVIDMHLDEQKDDFEAAQVDAVKNVFREEFGPVQPSMNAH